MKMNSSTCFGRWRITTPARSRCVIRAAPARARNRKQTPKLLEIGKAEVVQHGRDVAIFGLGNMFEVAEEAAQKLEEKGISVALINPRWIKPIDTGTLEFFARSVEVICTIEDHVLHNGFGCAVMEHLHSNQINTPVVRIGWPDQFIEHGIDPGPAQETWYSRRTRWWKKSLPLPAKETRQSIERRVNSGCAL